MQNTFGTLQVMVTTPTLPDPDREPHHWVVNEISNEVSYQSKQRQYIKDIDNRNGFENAE